MAHWRSLMVRAALVTTLGIVAHVSRPEPASAAGTCQAQLCAPSCELGQLACRIQCPEANAVWDTCMNWPCEGYSKIVGCAGGET